jgi:hypothetical protein
MTSRRFPAPWQVEQIPGGYKVLDANGPTLLQMKREPGQGPLSST